MFNNYWLALIVTFAVAVLWLRLVEYFAHRKLIPAQISRKIIHIGTGLIFILCWLLFPDKPYSRFLAALVPLIITIQFLLIGSGVIKDQAAVDSMSRTGVRQEILKGPLYYGIVFILVTILFWKDNPIGLISLILLCAGDGLAEIVGIQIDSKRLPWSNRKTVIGSLSMLIASILLGILYLYIFSSVGEFSHDVKYYFPSLVTIAFAGTIIESLTKSDLDNLTVPGIAILLGQILIIS